NGLDLLDEFFHVILALMVIKGEVLNDFLSFLDVLIAEFAVGGAVNLEHEMKGDMIIKKFGFEANDRWRDEGLFRSFPWKKLSKESGSKILPCGDGSCWKTFKPISSLIAKGILK
ncbi:hypothetical protein Tco_1520886, partial [Tanacetum coccineum]